MSFSTSAPKSTSVISARTRRETVAEIVQVGTIGVSYERGCMDTTKNPSAVDFSICSAAIDDSGEMGCMRTPFVSRAARHFDCNVCSMSFSIMFYFLCLISGKGVGNGRKSRMSAHRRLITDADLFAAFWSASAMPLVPPLTAQEAYERLSRMETEKEFPAPRSVTRALSLAIAPIFPAVTEFPPDLRRRAETAARARPRHEAMRFAFARRTARLADDLEEATTTYLYVLRLSPSPRVMFAV
nr:MAG TPA: hypothetical protein [Caudoviricetes sp.]